MNKFYDIGALNKPLDGPFQLENLGTQRIWASFGRPVRGDWGEKIRYDTNRILTDVTSEDYDKQFITRLLKIKPAYAIEAFINHHLEHFLKNQANNREDFLKHMKFEIYPQLKKKGGEGYVEFFITWLNGSSSNFTHQTINNTINISGNNAPIQFQQHPQHSPQTQQNEISNVDMLRFLELIRDDLNHIDAKIRSDFEMEINYAAANLARGGDAKPQLMRIGTLMKDVGLGTFTNLLASPIYDGIKHFLHL